MQTDFFKKDLFHFLILFVCLLAYGVFIPFLGFYWDDFPYIWFKHTTGVLGVIKAIALDRPVLGFFYAIPMTILGENPWIWQIFAIFCRWIFILSVFRLLNGVFPKNLWQNKLLILLFSVFPGFTQQWISVIYSHAFLIFAIYFFSLNLFVDLIKKETYHWTKLIVPLLLSFLCLLATEYLTGLEVLRPLIIFKIFSSKNPDAPIFERLKKTLAKWIPYLAMVLLFLYYRIFVASSVIYKVQKLETISTNPLSAILDMILVQFSNIYTSTVLVWSQIFKPLLDIKTTSIFTVVYFTILVVVFLITLFLMDKGKLKNLFNQQENTKWNYEVLIGSILTLFFVGIPFWSANLKPEIHFPNDRIFMPFILGSSAFAFLLIHIFKKNQIIFPVLFSLVFSLSLSYQVFLANNYRVEWDYLKQFFQQISWRIPSLEENTILVTDELPLEYYSDNSLTAAFNWLYSPESQNFRLPYIINYTKARLGKSLASLEKGTKIVHNYRTYSFQGSTDQLLLFYHQPPGCVHIADPDLDVLNPLIPKEIRPYASLSRLDLIGKEEKKNSVFFIEDHFDNPSWCFYYQKASLAVQNQDWAEAARLGDIAFEGDDYPNDASERLPFIEAYAMVGNWGKALNLSTQTIEISAIYQPMICRLWERINNSSSNVGNSAFLKSQEYLSINCTNNLT